MTVARQRANHHLVQRGLGGLARVLVRRYLTAVHVVGGDELPPGPLILAANHQSTLDVAVAVHVSRYLRRRFLTWAHPDVLHYLPFLDGRGLLRASTSPWDFKPLLNAAALGEGPPAALWIFPQGRCVPQAAPLTVMKGAAVLSSHCAPTPVVPAGILYSMYRREKPVVSMPRSAGWRTAVEPRRSCIDPPIEPSGDRSHESSGARARTP